MNDVPTMTPPLYPDATYVTPAGAASSFSSFLPNLTFYWRMCTTLKTAARLAKQGVFGTREWMSASLAIRDAMEKCGTKITIEGFDNFKTIDGPCVFIGNHMSTLETFILPSIINAHKPVTFVIKKSLMTYPFFCHVMRTRNPIVVQRKDPRADFTAVMEGGLDRLSRGISVVVFPQSTRLRQLSREHFNSLGIKLARKANVPVVPLALRTDAWGMGLFGLLKDHGVIRPQIPVHFRFGAPLHIEGNGKAEHEKVYTFIEQALTEWGIPLAPPHPNTVPHNR